MVVFIIMISKVNRKPNGEVLGIPIFLGADIVSEFVNSGTTHLEVTKILTANGILLEFKPIVAKINNEH